MTFIKNRKHGVTRANPCRRGSAQLASSIITVLVLGLPTAVLAADPGADSGSAEQAKTLPKVKVTAQELPEYRSESLSDKFTQPLLDTPQTLQVITGDLFNQQGATTLTEALRNSPGVGTFYAGENGTTSTGDAVYMRGFDTSGSIFTDGVRDLGSISHDLFNIEQIEVEKGPAGTDNGRTAPTGAINMMSKRAFLGDMVTGSASLGTDDQRRVTADLNQTLNGLSGAALRMNVMWQDSGVPGRDHVNNKRVGIAPSLGFGLETDTRFFVDMYYIKQDNIPDGFVPTIGLPGYETPDVTGTAAPGADIGRAPPVDPQNFYGTRNDHDDSTSQMVTLRFEHDFSDTLRLNNTLRWGQTRQDYLLTSFHVNLNKAKGEYTLWTQPGDDPAGALIDPSNPLTWMLDRDIATLKNQTNRILTNQTNLRADFDTGIVQHSVSAGLEFTQEKQDGLTKAGRWGAVSLYQPDWNTQMDSPDWVQHGAIGNGKTNTASAYVFDTAKFLDGSFLVTAGLRADHYKTTFRDAFFCPDKHAPKNACDGLPDDTIVHSDADGLTASDTLLNWKLGAVYKPTEQGSLYFDYAVSQQPPGGANFTLTTADGKLDNPDLDPQKAKTVELGSKWSLFDDALALNLAVFRTEVSNEISTDIDGNPTQTGKKRVQGVELSAVGNITENWAVSSGYMHQNTKVQEGKLVAQDGSSNLTYSPGDAFTSWTTYRFPFGLTVGGGVRYSGMLHRGTDGAPGTPAFAKSYTVYDAVASYAVSEHLMLRLNAYNLFDKTYVAAINKSGYRYMPGQPRSAMLTANISF